MDQSRVPFLGNVQLEPDTPWKPYTSSDGQIFAKIPDSTPLTLGQHNQRATSCSGLGSSWSSCRETAALALPTAAMAAGCR